MTEAAPNPEGLASEPPDLSVLGVETRSPFDRTRISVKVAPFALGALLAEASLLLPPGVKSVTAAWASLGLIMLVGLCLLLPWDRLPRPAAVLPPLIYCGSVLALSLAAGRDSGVGIVIFVPLLWTALYHDRWESAVVTAAIVVVELSVSVAQHEVNSTVARRLVLPTVLAAVIASAIHTIRQRVYDSHRRVDRLQRQLEEARMADERLRIALELQDDVVTRIFGATLTLRSAQDSAVDPETTKRIDGAVTELDETVRHIRAAVFDQTDDRSRSEP